MSAALVRGWAGIAALGAGAVGGKAWQLARLARYGFAVPPGTVVPAAVCRDWLAAAGLGSAIQEVLRQPAAGRPAALAALQARLLATPLPAGLAADLAQLAADPEWNGPLAVRSSAPQEDTAGTSFAGIHASRLNVRGAEALAAAVAAVWASLWTPAAVAYREGHGIDHAEAAMAVLVMPLVPARASGIAFTCDPSTGRDDRLLIHAHWGLGESLVGGQAAGDEIVLGENLEDDSLSLLAMRIGSKAVTSEADPAGGTRDVPTPAAQAAAAVLTPAQALALGEQLHLAALALDFADAAYDCEWAWDGDRFWLLQARPVTVRAPCTYPGLAGQPVIWSRGNTRDVVPEPLSPMDWGASRRLVNCLLEEGYRLSGFPLHAGAQRAGLFHGRLYLNLSLIQWEGYHAFAVEPAAMNRLVGGHQPEVRVAPLAFLQRLQRLIRMGRFLVRAGGLRRRGESEAAAAPDRARQDRERPLPADGPGLAAEMRRQIRQSRRLRGLHFMQGSGGASLSLLVDLIDAHLPGRGHALASALLAGGPPSVTARQGYELMAIARQAMADPVARAWLERHRQAGGDWRDLPADNPCRRAFADFLERYGHRGVYETYLRNPRWRERPDYLLDSLPGLAAVDAGALAERQRQAAAAALAEVRRALPWWKRGLLAMLRRSAKVETNGREAARSALMAYVEPGRRLALAIGRLWVEAGWLEAAEDIFLLLQCEVLAVLEGSRPGAALPPLVADRRARFDACCREPAPDVILVGGADGDREAAIGEVVPADAERFQGVPVGSGVATGTARLLHSPEEGGRLAEGDILVVPSTDPAWTPLFLKAGGLVMETGGFLSHGAIVAREFGIPAVVNLPGILAVLRDGERLQVDGGRGVVSRLPV